MGEWKKISTHLSQGARKIMKREDWDLGLNSTFCRLIEISLNRERWFHFFFFRGEISLLAFPDS